MSFVSHVSKNDSRALAQIDALLQKEGIKRDANLDYISAIYDDDYNVIATGSCFGNTLRCFAVDESRQGEGLTNQLVSHLMQVQMQRGNSHVFVYTKASSAPFFRDLGFYDIATVEGKLVFLENKRSGFESYLQALKAECPPCEGSAAIVMNANPFTNGHLYLAEQAAANCKALHIFVLSEDASLVPFAVRMRLVKEGTAHLKNVFVHESGPYMISNATFPSYFLKDEAEVIESHAKLDAAVFIRICKALDIKIRYVGYEPSSVVTGAYNRVLAEMLPQSGVQCRIIPRKECEGAAISAGKVRSLIKSGRTREIKPLVPPCTYSFFTSPEAAPVIEKIKAAENVIHY